MPEQHRWGHRDASPYRFVTHIAVGVLDRRMRADRTYGQRRAAFSRLDAVPTLRQGSAQRLRNFELDFQARMDGKISLRPRCCSRRAEPDAARATARSTRSSELSGKRFTGSISRQTAPIGRILPSAKATDYPGHYGATWRFTPTRVWKPNHALSRSGRVFFRHRQMHGRAAGDPSSARLRSKAKKTLRTRDSLPSCSRLKLAGAHSRHPRAPIECDNRLDFDQHLGTEKRLHEH